MKSDRRRLSGGFEPRRPAESSIAPKPLPDQPLAPSGCSMPRSLSVQGSAVSQLWGASGRELPEAWHKALAAEQNHLGAERDRRRQLQF